MRLVKGLFVLCVVLFGVSAIFSHNVNALSSHQNSLNSAAIQTIRSGVLIADGGDPFPKPPPSGSISSSVLTADGGDPFPKPTTVALIGSGVLTADGGDPFPKPTSSGSGHSLAA